MNVRIFGTALAAALFGSVILSGGAFAKGKPPPTTEAAQNLSVPAILVGPLGTLVCGTSDVAPSALVPPTGTPLTGYEVPGFYWVQKVHVWQAQCFNAPGGIGVRRLGRQSHGRREAEGTAARSGSSSFSRT